MEQGLLPGPSSGSLCPLLPVSRGKGGKITVAWRAVAETHCTWGQGIASNLFLGGMLGPEPQLDKGQGHSEGHIPETQGHSDCLRWMLNQNNKLPVLVSCPQRGRHQVTVDSAGRRVRPCQQTLCELQPKGKTRSRADSRQ